jgi:hypothetical protein
MGANDLIGRLTLAGVRLSVVGPDKLAAEPREALTEELRTLIRENKATLVAVLSGADDALPRAYWRLHYPDRGWREVCFAPTVSRSEALEMYTDATDAVPGWD